MLSQIVSLAREADEQPRLSLLYAYNVLQIVGFCLTAMILLTAWLSSKVRRSTAWYLFMTGWPLWCISHSLIFGYQTVTQGLPSKSIEQFCLLMPPTFLMQQCTIDHRLTFHNLQFHFALSAGIRQQRPPVWVDTAIITVPIVVWVVHFSCVIAVGLEDKSRVVRASNLMHRNLSYGTPATVSGILVGVTAIAMLIMEVSVAIIIFKNLAAFQRIRNVPGNHIVSTSMIVRISLFSLLPLLTLGFSRQSLTTHHGGAEARVSIATFPTAATLIFGTQRDMVRSWMFWRKDQPSTRGIDPMNETGAGNC
ncbi:hypothetical protein Moror_1360 [Moniliophthora roreri MCA 2997]|uniref:Uncharacterized protein n=1 Tax=Moniliophthora roreri (strain MCA 2997) TaxID=1381753 RepID=V2WQT4_MONRO|nr:hypothetical protein Moror_1360 [Moniliophthora roreri MCA 2997]